MPKSKASLKSSLRKSIIQAHRARRASANNLWLVHSVKTNKDWILPSDRQLVHWLYYLETNPDVVTFDLAPEPILSRDDCEIRATELDATVVFRDGRIEWHEVKADKSIDDPDVISQMQAQINAASMSRVIYRRFNDIELKPKVKLAMRWLKAISFASAIRDQECLASQTSLALALREVKSGNVQLLLNILSGHEVNLVLGLLVRLSIQGVVNLNLTNNTFGLQTRWEYCG